MVYCFTAMMMIGKCCPPQFIFDWPEQMEARRCQIWTIWWVWWDSPAKTGNVLYSFCWYGVWCYCVAREKLLPSLDWSGCSGIQLCHCCNVAISVDGFVPRNPEWSCSKKSRMITPFLSQKAVHITFPTITSVPRLCFIPININIAGFDNTSQLCIIFCSQAL